MTPDHEKALFAPPEFRLFWAVMFDNRSSNPRLQNLIPWVRWMHVILSRAIYFSLAQSWWRAFHSPNQLSCDERLKKL